VWLVWLILLLVGGLLLVWLALFAAVVVGSVATHDTCPRCGVSLGGSDMDRRLDDHYSDPRFRSGRADHCVHCGWRRS
jgi:hypothetical protein